MYETHAAEAAYHSIITLEVFIYSGCYIINSLLYSYHRILLVNGCFAISELCKCYFMFSFLIGNKYILIVLLILICSRSNV